MRRALPFLWVTSRKNGLKRFVKGLAQPKKLIATLLRLGILGFLIFGFSRSTMGSDLKPEQASPVLASYLSVVLILSVLGGLAERGIAFSPAEVDFLFAGPFGRRSLVLHHVAGLYPSTLLAAVLPFAFFGTRTANPALAFVGAALTQVVGIHLSLAGAVLASQLGEQAWKRLRGPLRIVSTLVVIGLVGLLVSQITSLGGFRGAVTRLVSSPAARIVLYPAIAAGDMAGATSLSAALPALLGSLASCAATLIILLSIQVNFLESSIGASERRASLKARVRSGRGLSAFAPETKPTAGTRLPAKRIFRGAGAVAWRQWIVARRSGRRLYISVALVLLVFFPAFLSGKSDPMAGLIATAILPFFLAGYFRFDFRGEGEQMAFLKSLPVSRTRLAAAELAVPATMTVAFQAILLGLLAALDRIPVAWIGPALLAAIPVTCGAMAAVNLAHFLGGKSAGVAGVLQLIFLLANLLLLGLIGWLIHSMGFGIVALIVLLAAAQLAILVALVALLGLAFAAHDVSSESA